MKKKILWTYIFLLLICTAIIGFIFSTFVENTYIKEIEKKHKANANYIADTLNILEKNTNDINYFNIAQKLSNIIGERITLVRDDGSVIADSHNNSIIFKGVSDKPEIKHAKLDTVGKVKRVDIITDELTYFTAYPPITINNEKIIIRLATSIDGIKAIRILLLQYNAIALALGLIITFYIGYFYVDKLVQPIKELSRATKMISKGYYGKNVKANTNDEIEELSNNFNRMSSVIKNTISELDTKNSELNAILSSMLSGIIAVDNNNRILIFNMESEKILLINKNTVINQFINITNIDSDIKEAMIHTQNTNKDMSSEMITIKNGAKKIIKFRTTPIINENTNEKIGVLCILQNVSEKRKLEKLRQEFVANVSHELRTPLTSISGFIETLRFWKELDDNNIEEIIQIMDMETQRLQRLINGILKLSEIENIKIYREVDKIEIIPILCEIKKSLEPIYREKNLKFDLQIEDFTYKLTGNKDWFYRMILNLCTNAIKYTEENGNIIVKFSGDKDNIRILVKDTGIGIPEEEQLKIFERFYRGDKSRSSNVRGTGLGLTIAKHVAQNFNGAIYVNSRLGEGSEFQVILPNES